MAQRLYFIATPYSDTFFKEKCSEFTFYSGFALSQKHKSMKSFHDSIKEIDGNLEILEISTKSFNPEGAAVSASNLKFYDEALDREIPLENIFKSSKVFENGGPFRDLLDVSPKDAEMDKRLTKSGVLKHFDYNDTIWELQPETMFYDWIYIKALARNKELAEEILSYDAFTDIEFNHQKSINCQARAAAIFVSLSKMGFLEEFLNDKEKFKQVYGAKR